MPLLNEKYLTMLLVITYTVLAFVFVSLKQTYQLTSNIFNNGKYDDNWNGYSLNLGIFVHAVVFVLLLWLPMFLCKDKMY